MNESKNWPNFSLIILFLAVISVIFLSLQTSQKHDIDENKSLNGKPVDIQRKHSCNLETEQNNKEKDIGQMEDFLKNNIDFIDTIDKYSVYGISLDPVGLDQKYNLYIKYNDYGNMQLTKIENSVYGIPDVQILGDNNGIIEIYTSNGYEGPIYREFSYNNIADGKQLLIIKAGPDQDNDYGLRIIDKQNQLHEINFNQKDLTCEVHDLTQDPALWDKDKTIYISGFNINGKFQKLEKEIEIECETIDRSLFEFIDYGLIFEKISVSSNLDLVEFKINDIKFLYDLENKILKQSDNIDKVYSI